MMSFIKKLLGLESQEDLAAMVADGALLVDVRTPGEFQSGHVKGSINIPLDQLGSQLGKLKNSKNIVVFCQSGTRSRMAKMLLQQKGFNNVVNGGTWKAIYRLMNT
ncbi:MAG: rhodanese-like domain-containing protein [Sphingobacteriia bacterium]|nr:MAG: rhodanese-like domain-containing protein [Sphingobacteriia bacterium]